MYVVTHRISEMSVERQEIYENLGMLENLGRLLLNLEISVNLQGICVERTENLEIFEKPGIYEVVKDVNQEISEKHMKNLKLPLMKMRGKIQRK